MNVPQLNLPNSAVLVLCCIFTFTTGMVVVDAASAQSTQLEARQQVQAERFFTRGMTYARMGDYEEALRNYERALERTPSQAAILSAMADAYHALEDVTTALFYAEQATQQAPDNVHYHRQLANLHHDAGNLEDAIATLEYMLEYFPQNRHVQEQLASLYSRVGAIDQAIGVYEELLDESGSSAMYYQRLLQLYLQTDDREGTVRALEGLIETAPGAPAPRRMLVDFILDESDGDLERAASLLEEVLELEPGDTETVLSLAELYRELDRSSDADALMQSLDDIEDASASELLQRASVLYARSEEDSVAASQAKRLLEQALWVEPEHYDALVMLADVHYRTGALAEAAELFQRALEINPRDQRVWLQAGAALLEHDQPEEAAAVAEEALLLFPNQLSLLRMSAYSHMEAGESQRAIERFNHTLQILEQEHADEHEEQSRVLSVLGLLYQRTEDIEASEEAYARAIELHPQNSMALNNLAYSLAEREAELDHALDLAEKAVELDAENASFLDTLGWVHYRLGNLEEARHWIGKSIDTGEASATVYEHYGDVLEKLGDLEKARSYWQRALEQDPDRSSARDRLQR